MFSLPVRFGWCRGISVLTLLASAPLAQAQGAPARLERANPLDAQARVPAVTHASALAGYRRLGEDQRIDWKSANETVNRIGGWKTYAREAQQPEPAAPAPAARSSTPAPAAKPVPSPGGQHRH
jgi:hypothetical protein